MVSIFRKELSLFDVTFVLRLTASPGAMLVAASSPTQLAIIALEPQKKTSRNLITASLGIMLPPLWFGLYAAPRYLNHAFTNGELCEDLTFWSWFLDGSYILGSLSPFWTSSVFFINIVTTALLCYLPPPKEIYQRLPYLKKGPGRRKRFHAPFSVSKDLCVSTMSTPNQQNLTPPRVRNVNNRSWMLALLYASQECYWAFGIISSAVDASGREYVLTYGQVWPLPRAFTVRCMLNARLSDAVHIGCSSACSTTGQIHLFGLFAPLLVQCSMFLMGSATLRRPTGV